MSELTEVRTVELTEKDLKMMWAGNALRLEFEDDELWIVDYDYKDDVDAPESVGVASLDETEADRLRYGKTWIIPVNETRIYAIHHTKNPEPDSDVVAAFVRENELFSEGQIYAHLPQA